MNVKEAEAFIGKYYHSGWKESYIGTTWENVKNDIHGRNFTVTHEIFIVKNGEDYKVWRNEK